MPKYIWICLLCLGCYPIESLHDVMNKTMIISSVRMCQEICHYNNIDHFAIKVGIRFAQDTTNISFIFWSNLTCIKINYFLLILRRRMNVYALNATSTEAPPMDFQLLIATLNVKITQTIHIQETVVGKTHTTSMKLKEVLYTCYHKMKDTVLQ